MLLLYGFESKFVNDHLQNKEHNDEDYVFHIYV